MSASAGPGQLRAVIDDRAAAPPSCCCAAIFSFLVVSKPSGLFHFTYFKNINLLIYI